MVRRFGDLYEVLFDAASEKAPPGFEGLSYIGVNEGYTQMGPKRDQVLKLDRRTYERRLSKLLKAYAHIDQKIFFQCIHKAFDETLEQNPEATHIFYHIHSPNKYSFLNYLRHYPKTKILMSVREPLQNFESSVSHSIE